MIKNKKISVVIPCRNEEKNIGLLITGMPRCVDEIIVVDNKSTDKTARVAKKTGAIVLKEKRAANGIGYGYAHQIGLEKAGGDFIAALDGDRTYPSSKIPEIINFMEKNDLDFVSCNRLPLKNKKAISPTRRLGINILNWEIRLLYGYPISDALTGMWVMRKETAKKLALKEGGWDLSLEIKLEAISSPEINFAEYHIPHFIRDGNLSKQMIWKTGFGHFKYVLKRRFTTDNFWYQMAATRKKIFTLNLAGSK